MGVDPSGKIRVLHCLETIGSGGVEQRRLSLARHLDPQKYEQRVVCSYVIGGIDKRFEKLGITVVAIRGLLHIFNFPYYVRLIKAVRSFRPDIIHGAVFEGVVSAVVGGLLCGVPVIIIEETSGPENRSWRGTMLVRFLARFADFVVGTSPSVMDYLSTIARIPQSKQRLITNGVEIPQEPEEAQVESVRNLLGLATGNFVVGSVGRLRDTVKRFSDLIRAMSLLKDSHPSLRILIVGDGNDRGVLERLAVELGVSKYVLFAGFQEEPGVYYRCMDVFALVSHMEGFGLVAVEAMFYRLPVIATRVGGLRDIVLDGETGILVDRHSPESITNAIRRLLDSPSLRKQMGDAGYGRASRHFSAFAYTGMVDSLYQEVLTRMKK